MMITTLLTLLWPEKGAHTLAKLYRGATAGN